MTCLCGSIPKPHSILLVPLGIDASANRHSCIVRRVRGMIKDAHLTFHNGQELTRSRCFDGAYARGLWAAGFSFHVVAEAAAFSDTPLGAGGCREEAEAPIKAYAAFLRVRQTKTTAVRGGVEYRFTRGTLLGLSLSIDVRIRRAARDACWYGPR